jgi:catechol 2,3-dioxygenase-like lactoylglutathione lyase family enzyme
MSAELNHTIVAARDRRESAEFLARILGLSVGAESGPFLPVPTGNGVTLDYATSDQEITPQHYAFLVPEDEFDGMYQKIKDGGVQHWADPGRKHPGQINHNDGGRGVYFLDPSGHYLEILTRPYGSGG